MSVSLFHQPHVQSNRSTSSHPTLSNRSINALIIHPLGNSVSSWISLKLQVFGTKTTCSSKAIRYRTIAVLSASDEYEQFENGGTMRDADKTCICWIMSSHWLSFAYNPRTKSPLNSAPYWNYQTTQRKTGHRLSSYIRSIARQDNVLANYRFLWHWFESSLLRANE